MRGEIVGEDAPQKRSQVEQLMNNAALISYQGRNIKTSGLIESFSTGHPNTINGGCSFDMTIKEIRVANGSGYIGNTTPTETRTTPLKDVQETGTQKIEQNSTSDEVYTTRDGDSIYSEFVGGGLKNYAEMLENNPYIDPTNVKANTKIVVTKKEHGGSSGRFSGSSGSFASSDDNILKYSAVGQVVTNTKKLINLLGDSAKDLKILFGGGYN